MILVGIYFQSSIINIYENISRKLYGAESVSIDSLIKQIERDIALPPPLRNEKVSTSQSDLTRQGTISETNLQRIYKGLPSLSENKKLNFAAEAKAKDIFTKQYFDHISPSGKGPSNLVEEAGYDFIAVGENLALGNFENDRDLVNAWMESPGHRANILSNKYSEIGIAVVKGTFEGKIAWVAVQEFALPASACPDPDKTLKNQIENYQASVDKLYEAVNQRKTEIESSESRNSREYKTLVNEYNQMINQYNILIGEVKSLIKTYNSQVDIFNKCLNS
jgi:uncharacterized protein YkwD